VAPTARSYSVAFDPLGLVARFPGRYPGLLESGTSSATQIDGARYDILPMCSGEALRLRSDGSVCGPHAQSGGGFLDALDRWWRALQLETCAGPLPFTGGWLVYLGYELAGEIEPSLRQPPPLDPSVALALRTPAAWIRERSSGRAWLVAETGSEGWFDRFAADVACLPATRRPPPPDLVIQEEDPQRFLRGVGRALDYIAAGDVYQANLSREWRGESQELIDPTVLYARLRTTNPSPFAALLRDGDFAVISSSPERLLSIRDGVVATRPIAGTRPRGRSIEEDLALINALSASEKERAEHTMLIDLERNDLGRVCCGGSVQVDEYMSVESYAHVHHIVSNVSGRLRAGLSPIDAIRALFPGGTITGCPKVRCMQIIAELEGVARGAYTGSLGYLNRDGSCDLNILIRTITSDGHVVRFRAGAGIVADSDALQELAETRAKAEGMLRAVTSRA
jgi:anthranilate synthase component 1